MSTFLETFFQKRFHMWLKSDKMQFYTSVNSSDLGSNPDSDQFEFDEIQFQRNFKHLQIP